MTEGVAGYEINNAALDWLEPLLPHWFAVNSRYAKALKLVPPHGGDALYWYNERPNVGDLAAAAWLSGMVAIEEYVADKLHKEKLDQVVRGRSDLYIHNSRDHEARFEAKQCFGHKKGSFDNQMKSALADSSLNRGNTGQKIAVVFYVPRLPAGESSAAKIALEVDHIRSKEPDILAYSFPSGNNQLTSPFIKKHKGFVWPGVIMAMRLCPVG